MKLKRLVIHGFKSFKDRTVINFDDGITGIVGPNGCGKSNIIDAFFWVTGGQSAKHLRSSSMREIIFAGSAKSNPGAWAEVSLILENTDGKHIHIGNKVFNPSEIQITRKLYRNGETEYRINNAPCRLKDIQEIFMDTGAGAKSYSVIAQGEINRLVEARPEERRSMIEEVAGITKFKVRKKESLRKIEQTQMNLGRLNDLQVEIEKNLRSLQKQAEKAERAKTLKDKIKRNDLIVNSHKVLDYLKGLKDKKNALNEKELDLRNWQTRREIVEVDLEEERYRKDEISLKVEELQREFNTISRELAAAEERLKFLKQSKKEKGDLLSNRQQEIVEIEEELEGRKLRLFEIKKEKEHLEDRGKGNIDFDELSEKVDALKDDLDLKRDFVEGLKSEISQKKEELQNLEHQTFKNTSKLDEYANNLQDFTKEIDFIEERSSFASAEVSEMRKKLGDAEKRMNDLLDTESTLKSKVDQLNTDFENQRSKHLAKTKEIVQVESRLNVLNEMKSSLEGVNAGAAEFLNTVAGDGSELFGRIVQCDEKYTGAVKNLLGEVMEVLVSLNNDYSSLKSWHDQNKDKKIDFFLSKGPVSESCPETVERLKMALNSGDGQIVPLKELIRVEEKYVDLVAPLLEGHYVSTADDREISEKCSAISAEINFKAITNLGGDILVKNIGDGVVVTFPGDNDDNSSMVARNNKILKLEEGLEEARVEASGIEEKVTDISTKLDGERNEYEETRELLSDAKAEFAVTNTALKSKLAGLESGNARLEILRDRKNEISKSRLELLESEEELNGKVEKLSSDIEGKTEIYETSLEEFEWQRSAYEKERDTLIQLTAEERMYDDRLRDMSLQIEDIDSQITRHGQRLESNKRLIIQYGEEIETIDDELNDLGPKSLAAAEDLQSREATLLSMKDELNRIVDEMNDRENEVRQLTGNIGRAEKKIVELEMKLEQFRVDEEQIVRNVFEKYRIDLRKAVGTHLEYSEEDYRELADLGQMYVSRTEDGEVEIEAEVYEFGRRYGNDLRECEQKLVSYKNEYGNLGEINWQAVEDYRRQKLRFDFLREQEGELKQSLNDLERAIEHIDEKSKKRFKMAFGEINSRFQKVFPIIFNGGGAELMLVGNEAEENEGINIMARLPGKKVQNLTQLSGGEKTLVGISLIFSIFLVKPSPFCLLDEVDAALDDANIGRFNELLREMSVDSQFVLITHNKKTMEMNDVLYGITMQEPGISKAVSVQLH